MPLIVLGVASFSVLSAMALFSGLSTLSCRGIFILSRSDIWGMVMDNMLYIMSFDRKVPVYLSKKSDFETFLGLERLANCGLFL